MAGNFKIPSSGGTSSLKYVYNCAADTISFSNNATSWLTISNDGTNKILTLTATENTSAQARTATLTPSVNGTPCNDKAINVVQSNAGCSATLTCDTCQYDETSQYEQLILPAQQDYQYFGELSATYSISEIEIADLWGSVSGWISDEDFEFLHNEDGTYDIHLQTGKNNSGSQRSGFVVFNVKGTNGCEYTILQYFMQLA